MKQRNTGIKRKYRSNFSTKSEVLKSSILPHPVDCCCLGKWKEEEEEDARKFPPLERRMGWVRVAFGYGRRREEEEEEISGEDGCPEKEGKEEEDGWRREISPPKRRRHPRPSIESHV